MLAWLLTAELAYPCTRTTAVSAREMLDDADAIVRVRVEDASPIGGMSVNAVRFVVLEMLKGDEQLTALALPGRVWSTVTISTITSHRTASCVQADAKELVTYRTGAEYLLVLRNATGDFGWTTRWYPFGPVNEQLRGVDDPWVLWVRDRVK